LRRPMSRRPRARASLRIYGKIVDGHVRLRWRPVNRAVCYVVLWLDKARNWCALGWLEDEEIVPGPQGFVEWVDEYPGAVGPGGAYRVRALARHDLKLAESHAVVLRRAAPTRSTKDELRRRLSRRRIPIGVRELITRLKCTPHAWSMLLPAGAGKCFGKRIEVEVQTAELSDAVIDLLGAILKNLPKLAARAEKAVIDTRGVEQFDEDVEVRRACIWIDQET
jgi:hypothetical protein